MNTPLVVTAVAALAIVVVMVYVHRAEVRTDWYLLRMNGRRLRRRSRRPIPRRKPFEQHAAEALADPEAELLAAGAQFQHTDPADLMARFYEETPR